MMDIIKAKMARASVFALVAAAAGAAMAGLGPGDYVQNGLVAIYDGFYNAKDAAGVPIHDANATTWANLANGCGDFTLPQGSFTLGVSNVTLNTTAVAPDCSVALASGNITLEACVKSETASATGSNKNFLEIANRAGMGYDARNNYHFTVYVLGSSTYGSAKKRFFKCPGANFADYAPDVHSVSWVSANNAQGTIRADGESGGTLSHFYTNTNPSDPPDGELSIGNSDVSYTYFCIRIYNRGLTDDERNLNAAIDAVRFQGKSCGEVTLPDGYSFDENGNLVGPQAVGQHRIVTGGTVTFEAPYSEAATLVNAASVLGSVTFDESSYAADEPHALSFSGFDALANTKTVFDGGWWDFSAGAFLPTDANGRTVSLEGGAVVTNVDAVTMAGTTGTDNTLRLTETSSLYAGSFILGSEAVNGGQRSKVAVDGGSLLNVSGALEFSNGEKWRGTGEQTGNSLTVSGEGSRLVVGGQTSLGRNRDNSNSQYMRFGGSTFTVTDGAAATLDALNVDTGLSYGGESNRVVFSNSARVTMTSLSFATSGAYGGRGGNLLEILDGAVVTNSGTMMFGMDDVAKALGNRIVVSNATFYTKLRSYADRGKYLIWGNGNSFVVSGANAELTIGDTMNGFFKNKGSSFVVENGATLNSPSGFYCYTAASSSNTVLVTTGATMNFPGGVYTVGQSNVGRSDSAFNKLVVESGATVSTASSKDIYIYGTGCELTVDDGSVNCGGNVQVGSTESYDTNCLAKVCGTHPKMTITKSLNVKNGSCLRFELPATGYDANAATDANPVIDVGATAGNGVFIDETSRLELVGMEELMAYLTQANVRCNYVLAKANSGGINLPDGQLEALQAQLPEGMTLDIVSSGSGQSLVLRAGPKSGMYLIFK